MRAEPFKGSHYSRADLKAHWRANGAAENQDTYQSSEGLDDPLFRVRLAVSRGETLGEIAAHAEDRAAQARLLGDKIINSTGKVGLVAAGIGLVTAIGLAMTGDAGAAIVLGPSIPILGMAFNLCLGAAIEERAPGFDAFASRTRAWGRVLDGKSSD